MSTVGSIPDMAPPGGQEDILLVGSADERGRHADRVGAVDCLIDRSLNHSPATAVLKS